eukprot:GHRR01005942.1.p1 GENE.GHRR01005942.1~~GHRR01005942.1.p1  ORF type:complete len:163 (+),score=38.38 GHRR01005942.1:1661-2149(+)
MQRLDRSMTYVSRSALFPADNLTEQAYVWSQYTTDASDSQDVAHATQKVISGMFAAVTALGMTWQPLQHQQSVLQQLPVQLDAEANAALRRLQERACNTNNSLFELLLMGLVADWEAMIISSFRAGISMDLQESTLQHQLTHESGCHYCLAVHCATASQGSA